MFDNAKVEDRIWYWKFGWGTIKDMRTIDSSTIFGALFDSNHYAAFDINGKTGEFDLNPSVFWDEVKYEVPKRKVTKYLNVTKNDVRSSNPICFLHENEDVAKSSAIDPKSYFLIAYPVTEEVDD